MGIANALLTQIVKPLTRFVLFLSRPHIPLPLSVLSRWQGMILAIHHDTPL